MTSAELDTLASLIAAKVLAELQATDDTKSTPRTDRHLTPREYARMARIAEAKVYDAIKSGKLIALPTNPKAAKKRWKIPRWSIERYETEQHQEMIAELNAPRAVHRKRVAADAHVPKRYG